MSRSPAIDTALRKAIKASGLTHYGLGQLANVAPSVLDRFMLKASDHRRRDLRLATAARIAKALKMVLVQAAAE